MCEIRFVLSIPRTNPYNIKILNKNKSSMRVPRPTQPPGRAAPRGYVLTTHTRNAAAVHTTVRRSKNILTTNRTVAKLK